MKSQNRKRVSASKSTAFCAMMFLSLALARCSVEERDFSSFLDDGGSSEGGLGGQTGNGDGDGDGDGSGGASDGSGGGGVGAMCKSSISCAQTAPICEEGECRECEGHAECSARSTEIEDGQLCVEGACVECAKDTDCTDHDEPICGDDHECRGCTTHAECGSGACELDSGRCVEEEFIVYVLPGTGLNGECGTKTTPCLNFNGAYPKLSSSRNTIVIQKTTAKVDGSGVALPALAEIKVIGNGVTIGPYTGDPAFEVSAGRRLILDGVTLTTSVTCEGADLEVYRSHITTPGDTAYSATNCNVTVVESRVEGSGTGIRAVCDPYDCSGGSYTQRVERTWFAGNSSAASLHGDDITVRNNIFVDNGIDAYTEVMSISAKTKGLFSFNTMWGNFNNCIYIGLFNFSAPTVGKNNIDANNFPGIVTGDDCASQVYLGDAPSYTVSEVTWPGAGNQTADPLFVDPAMGDFNLQEDSPAINASDTSDISDLPDVDFFGNPRLVGDGPDCGAIEFQ